MSIGVNAHMPGLSNVFIKPSIVLQHDAYHYDSHYDLQVWNLNRLRPTCVNNAFLGGVQKIAHAKFIATP